MTDRLSGRRRPGHTLLLALLLVLGGCVTLPASVDGPVGDDAPSVAQAAASPQAYADALVRWGGSIAAVENRAHETHIEVVARGLQSSGRPREGGDSSGRFLAVVDGFLDPAVYARGRLLTVLGAFDGVETRKVGDYDYPYARVRVHGHQLWQPLPEVRPMPYYYDPWYYHDPYFNSWRWRHGPFYPYHPRYRYW